MLGDAMRVWARGPVGTVFAFQFCCECKTALKYQSSILERQNKKAYLQYKDCSL